MPSRSKHPSKTHRGRRSPDETIRAAPRVLIADDQPLSQEILLEMFGDFGCEADVAADGAAAVEHARACRYDLLLMDIQMPIMDGLVATRAIRALPGYQATPIIAVTATEVEEELTRCLAAGMSGVLCKPITPDLLERTLRLWLPNHVKTANTRTAVCDTALARALNSIAGLTVPVHWQGSEAEVDDYVGQLERFITLHGRDMEILKGLLAGNDRAGAQVTAHNLSGIAGLLGVRRIASVSREIEQALYADTPAAEIGRLLLECSREMKALATAIQALPKAGSSRG